jgi:hypothetical protein
MAELRERRREIEAWGGSLVFLMPPGTSPGPDFTDLPARTLLGEDPDHALLGAVAQARGACLGGSPPVIALCDAQGRVTFVSQGYRIGVWSQILSETTH